MKRALLIGIDEYDAYDGLDGCVNDVRALLPLLERNVDARPNFECRALTSDAGRVERRHVLESLDALLAPGSEVALFYFAGHGIADGNDVGLVTQDGQPPEDGVALSTLLGKVQRSSVGEVIVILDCCFSGKAGGSPQLGSDVALLRQGVALLAASRGDQAAAETGDARGSFSVHLCGALDGGAADVRGHVSAAGLYAYLSESFGAWDQRPTFKANLERVVVLRSCEPAVPDDLLRRLPEIFPEPGADLQLDPSYEPDAQPRDPLHEEVFSLLQRCRSAKLVVPVDAEHMYFAAMQSKACRLTPLGRHYWRMAEQDRL